MTSFIPPIASGSLPSTYPGPYPVGFANISHAPKQPYTLPVPKLKSGIPALGVRDLSYAVYYPCEVQKKGWFGGGSKVGISWLPRPVASILQGYSYFLGNHPAIKAAYPLLRVIGGRLTIPVHPLAPLASPSSSSSPSPSFPLVIFSHGLAGTLTTYSSYCASLASEGYVVLAVGHMDGSGPFVRVRGAGKDGGELGLEYLKYQELDWSPKSVPGAMEIRSLQLSQRITEIYEVIHGFKSLIDRGSSNAVTNLEISLDDGGFPKTNSSANTSGSKKSLTPQEEWLSSWYHKVETNRNITLTGHSFGGCTVLSLLETEAPDGFEKIQVGRAIALDPWLEPLPTPAASTNKEDQPQVPLLIINSEGFTLWSSHFRRLLKFVKESKGSLMSLVGCDHQSFSDFPLLVGYGSPQTLMTRMHDLSMSFINGRLSESKAFDAGKGKKADDGVLNTNRNGKLEGKPGDVVVHVLAADGKEEEGER